ncbi:hypothetical protein BDZ91DRAFT_736996 [Kalaharituber pfeilii]|nr:hypothetical protein BDZ91DRAFT_736996 [Kalaharituber pfeilii]
MCDSNCLSGLREQIIDNVYTARGWDRKDIVVATLKNDAGYQAFVYSPWVSQSRPAYTSTYCNDTTQALKSLLKVVEAAVWHSRESNLTQAEKEALDLRRRQLSGIHPRPTF